MTRMSGLRTMRLSKIGGNSSHQRGNRDGAERDHGRHHRERRRRRDREALREHRSRQVRQERWRRPGEGEPVDRTPPGVAARRAAARLLHDRCAGRSQTSRAGRRADAAAGWSPVTKVTSSDGSDGQPPSTRAHDPRSDRVLATASRPIAYAPVLDNTARSYPPPSPPGYRARR